MTYDLVVIGGGSGGVRAARMAGAMGAKVAIIEERWLGGTCVNVGCVPKKMLSIAGHYAADLRDMRAMGWSVPAEASFDWGHFADLRGKEIGRLNGIYERMLGGAGVEIVWGRGVLLSRNQVAVGERKLDARNVLIAVGGRPWRPSASDLPGVEHSWTSEDMFELRSAPARVAVVGGGYIACEFASILAGLGVETHLVYRGDALLRGFDEDVRAHLTEQMQARGLNIHLNCAPDRIDRKGEQRIVTMKDGGNLEVDGVLLATGRVPYTDNLGLAAAGVATQGRGAIVVDDRFETSAKGVYAVGDVINRVQLTPVALAEGMVVAHQLFGNGRPPVRYDCIPTAVFTNPPVATVGLTEEAAVAAGQKVRVYRSAFRPLKHTLTGHDERSFMKLIVDDGSDRVVGVHMVGDDAAEIMQGFGVAVNAGLTKAQFDATIGIHPTAAEEFVTMREPS